MHGLRLRDLREDKDLKQKDIASVLCISQTSYSKYETGKRDMPMSFIERLADFYDTSTDYILGRTDNSKPYGK